MTMNEKYHQKKTLMNKPEIEVTYIINTSDSSWLVDSTADL